MAVLAAQLAVLSADSDLFQRLCLGFVHWIPSLESWWEVHDWERKSLTVQLASVKSNQCTQQVPPMLPGLTGNT